MKRCNLDKNLILSLCFLTLSSVLIEAVCKEMQSSQDPGFGPWFSYYFKFSYRG